MILGHADTRAQWLKLVAAFRAARVSSYVPEYKDDGERSLNHRYYR